jgi:hypothetical protein
MEKLAQQSSWESSDTNYLSGQQTIAADSSDGRSQNCDQSGDLSSFEEQGTAGSSDAQPSLDELSASLPPTDQTSDAALNESASGSIAARKLREKLLSLKKEEQDLGNKQWRATKLEMVGTCDQSYCRVFVFLSMPFFLWKGTEPCVAAQGNLTSRLRVVRKEMQAINREIEVIFFDHSQLLADSICYYDLCMRRVLKLIHFDWFILYYGCAGRGERLLCDSGHGILRAKAHGGEICTPQMSHEKSPTLHFQKHNLSFCSRYMCVLYMRVHFDCLT